MFLSNISCDIFFFFFGNKNNETNTQHKRHSKNSKYLVRESVKKQSGNTLKIYIWYDCIYESKERALAH